MSKCKNCRCANCWPPMTKEQREYEESRMREKRLDIKKYIDELPELEKIIKEIEKGEK